MKIAAAIFKYFPYGGLQLDMMRAVRELSRRSHSVTIFAMEWNAPAPELPSVEVKLLPIHGWSNHARAEQFAKVFHQAADGSFDRTFAWNRVPGCDFYFCADNCFLAESLKKHSPLALRVLPRYRVFLQMEKSIFQPDSKTKCLYLTKHQAEDYKHFYQTPENRLFLLPPGINEAVRQTPEDSVIRAKMRQQLNLKETDLMLIQAGFNVDGKGSDLALNAVASLPETLREQIQFYFVGGNRKDKVYTLALSLGLSDRVHFPGAQTNFADWLKAADLMVHPARNESAGSVLLESLACGTPVLCSGECGFADFVRASGCFVTTVPTAQTELDQLLKRSLEELPQLKQKNIEFAQHFDFYKRASAIADIIEKEV